jgi:hypothetical protein
MPKPCRASLLLCLAAVLLATASCGGGGSAPASSSASGGVAPASVPTAAIAASAAPIVASTTPAATNQRPGFVGAFFRAVGPVPYGVFSATATLTAPKPYPSPTTALFGAGGYCDAVAANGLSISSGYPVDATKLADIVSLNVKWTRTTVATAFDDLSHLFGAGQYAFADLDSAQCALARNNIAPVIEIDAGPVQYNGALLPQFVSTQVPIYKTPADYAAFCSAVATHETQTFGASRYSVPGNEVNTNPTLFPQGAAQVAAYAEACYKAIKAVQPAAIVYGLELNMEATSGAAAFVQQLYGLGCAVGTCYDALSIHLYMPYPIPPAGTPCFPNPGGNYDMQCITDIQTAAHAPTMHVLIGETAYMVPSTVPDETTKATAVTAAFTQLSAQSLVDGASYSNVDECALYPTGYFSGGCLIGVWGNKLPAYAALQTFALTH